MHGSFFAVIIAGHISRLEGMSKLGRYTCIIISRPTLELVKDLVEVEQLSETAVKGKLSAVEMFEVKALA